MVLTRGRGIRMDGRGAALCVAAITLLVFLPALRCGFVNLDDPDYVLNNPLLTLPFADMIVSAFTQAHVGWWMPLTWLSLALDFAVWGENPVGFHLTNIVLHAVNAGLVTLLAARIGGAYLHGGQPYEEPSDSVALWGIPILAGLLFGIHPLRVESVVWVTERKDVLNGVFTIGAMLAYLRFMDRREAGSAAGRQPLFSMVLFACSLMAKSVSVGFPLLLLVVDWHLLRRFERERSRAIIAEKIPYFLLSAAMALVTLMTTAGSSYLVPLDMFPFHQRLLVSGAALIHYCRLMIFPVGITPMFMVPDPIPPSYAVMAVAAGLLCGLAIYLRRYRWVPALWLSFLIPLLPVLAFFQNGSQAYAARFTYLPSIGPSIAVACLAAGYYRRFSGKVMRRILLFSAAVALVGFYGGMTVWLTGFWKDTGTLWTRAIAIEPTAQFFKERGVFRYQKEDFAGAVEDFSISLSLLPKVWRPYVHNLYAHRGEALRAAGRYEEAVNDFTEAIRRYPHPSYFRFRGDALMALGRATEAEADYSRAGSDDWKIDWYWEQGSE